MKSTNASDAVLWPSFDPVWESRYKDDPEYRNRYPFSSVVTFVFRNRPRDRSAADVSVLEVGCGNGSNLWFAAREGFKVAGVDGSMTAIEYARRWFEREGLVGDFRVGDYTALPFKDDTFHLVIDRAALSFCGRSAVEKAFAEVHRVLMPGGRFLFTPYSDRCSSFDGLPDADGCYRQVTTGTCTPGAQIRFYSLNEVRELFSSGWQVIELEHHEYTAFDKPLRNVHAEWLVIAQKM